MSGSPGKNERQILILCLAVEGFLALLFFIWAYVTGHSEPLFPSAADAGLGVFHAGILMLLNLGLLSLVKNEKRFFELRSFVDEVVYPLARELSFASMLVVSLAAGVGEELFFRALIQNEFGLVAAALVFAFLHFGPAVRVYPRVAIFYFLIGLYLGFIYYQSTNIWPAIIAHAVYDAAALCYLKTRYRPESSSMP